MAKVDDVHIGPKKPVLLNHHIILLDVVSSRSLDTYDDYLAIYSSILLSYGWCVAGDFFLFRWDKLGGPIKFWGAEHQESASGASKFWLVDYKISRDTIIERKWVRFLQSYAAKNS